MKKLLLILTLLCSWMVGASQEPEKSIEERMTDLENIVTSLQTRIDEVTRQNLALKHAISLTPTMAEYTAENGVIYRLLEAKGNRAKGEFELVISALNPTKKDITVGYDYGPQMVDETGYAYVINTDQISAKIANRNISSSGTTLMPDAPVEMVLRYSVNHEPQYIKYLKLGGSFLYSGSTFRFANIPIKWE